MMYSEEERTYGGICFMARLKALTTAIFKWAFVTQVYRKNVRMSNTNK